MNVGGILDVSTKDIPNRSTMVIFTAGCNLQCQFCHNKRFLNPEIGKDYHIGDLIERIKSNNLISSVSISGGEPTLQKDIVDLCKALSKLGIYLSIDTNGTNPDIIELLIPHVDRIALDLKSPLDKLRMKAIIKNDTYILQIKNSIEMVNKSKIDFEIRTTYVGKLMKPEDIRQILSFLKEVNFRGNFVIQQYQHSEGVGEKAKKKFEKPKHITLVKIIEPYIKRNLPFKIYIRDDVVGYKEVKEQV